MKCPITFKMYIYPDEGAVAKGGECIKEECAWYLPEWHVCAITAIALDMENIYPTLQEMSLKMPHEAQFRK